MGPALFGISHLCYPKYRLCTEHKDPNSMNIIKQTYSSNQSSLDKDSLGAVSETSGPAFLDPLKYSSSSSSVKVMVSKHSLKKDISYDFRHT